MHTGRPAAALRRSHVPTLPRSYVPTLPRSYVPTLLCVLLSLVPLAGRPSGLENPPGPVVNSLGMRLVPIPAGEFVMGSPADEPGRLGNEGPLHRVRISRPLLMGAHEVTVGDFDAFVADTGYRTEAERDADGGFGIDFQTAAVKQTQGIDWRSPGFPDFVQTPRHPVLLISWADAEAFCRWLSGREGLVYRLPTEAEWEYAARAGTASRYWFGHADAGLADTANVADRALRDRMPAATWSADWSDGAPFTAPVGRFRPNPWGLYDMHGNVWEWTSDGYSEYAPRALLVDPRGPDHAFRSIRGGGWFNPPAQQRSAMRVYFKPTFRYCLLSGFRVVREV
jgi:sulfatase modifying factor 1